MDPFDLITVLALVIATQPLADRAHDAAYRWTLRKLGGRG